MTSERTCIRSCKQRGVHFATCEHSGPSYAGTTPCMGCAPRECRAGSLICDRCFGQMRRLLDDAPDLLGRLRSLIDPSKAKPLDQVRVRISATEPAAAVDSDPLDALNAVEAVMHAWYEWGEDLTRISNDKTAAIWFGERVLDRHKPVDGIREAWSVRDAVDQWGVERVPSKSEHPWEPDDEREEVATPIPEWGPESLITTAEAEQVAGSASTLRRWIRRELVAPAGQVIIAGVRTKWFRYSDVVRVRDEMKENMANSQFKADGEE